MVSPRVEHALRVTVLSIVLLALVGVAWWWAGRPRATARFVSVPVSRGDIERRVTATGTVNPVLTIIVGSYVSGVISSMSCDYNTRVRKGQICAKIDPRPYRAALQLAEGTLQRDTGQLEGARIDLKRYADALARNAIAHQLYDDQLALVHQLEGSVKADEAAVASARVNLEYTDIISPVDGTVVARNITIGQTVAASFQTPTLFLIATDLTKMQVDTNVSESDIASVKEGDPASFTVEAFADRSFPGSVVQVRQAPQTVQNVVTYDVVVGVANPDFLLKPGMTATVGIVIDRRHNVLRVPDQALRFVPSTGEPRTPASSAPATGGHARLWVLRNGKPEALTIQTGLDDDTWTEVPGGTLHEGDQVIIGEERGTQAGRTGAFRFGL